MTYNPDPLQLNSDLFKAEEQENVAGMKWNEFLRRYLSDEFRIRRSNWGVPLQDKEAMIRHIEAGSIVHREISDEKQSPENQADDHYSVVNCIVTMPDGKRYHNTKLFVRRGSGNTQNQPEWRCMYWHVLALPQK